jgi:hypothetical protein
MIMSRYSLISFRPLLRQPLLQLLQRLASVRYLVLLTLVHLRIRLPLLRSFARILETRVPAYPYTFLLAQSPYLT